MFAMARLAISFSRGLKSIRNIETFLDVDRVVPPVTKWDARDEVFVVVWGRKESSRKALAFASEHQLPVQFLEDGFIRTCSANSHSRTCYSIIVDRKGVYYDATVGSEFEQFLSSTDSNIELALLDAGEELLQACLEIIVENNITKYNYCPDYVPASKFDDRKRVLVVDQTQGDCSVIYGGMDEHSFEAMLETAVAENPDAQIVVKTHPDVLAGRNTGYLNKKAADFGVDLFTAHVNPMSFVKTFDHVYVGTSQLGFEALLCKKQVSVFGRPYYAGWGLTDDRVALPNRGKERDLIDLFYAAYMRFARYVNPITGEPWTLAECLEHVLLQKRVFQQNAHHFLCTGITPWKRRYISRYLRSPSGSVKFCGISRRNKNSEKNNRDAVATWGYRDVKLDSGADKTQQRPIARIEDGFLRSTGLGSDFNAPSSLVIDWAGMYFNPSPPSDLEQLLNTYECSLEDVLRARRLIRLILSANLTKYNVGGSRFMATRPAARRALLVIGQVENDASVAYGCDEIQTNTALLKKVRAQNPDAWILFKPHPDVVAGNRPGSVAQDVLNATVDCVSTTESIVSCIENTDELHTMTSLSGFEALLRNKTVFTYGRPFYSGWGLTKDSQQFSSRRKQRTLEELVYCSLIAYPRYMDISTGEFTTPENIVFKIKSNQMNTNNNPNWSRRQVRKLINVCKGLSYAP